MPNKFAVTVLFLVAIAGVVPFVLVLGAGGDPGSKLGPAYNEIVLQPWSSVVYAVLFGVGALMMFRVWVQIGSFAKRVFVAHRNHQGVDDEKDNEEPWREDRQRHQI